MGMVSGMYTELLCVFLVLFLYYHLSCGVVILLCVLMFGAVQL